MKLSMISSMAMDGARFASVSSRLPYIWDKTEPDARHGRKKSRTADREVGHRAVRPPGRKFKWIKYDGYAGGSLFRGGCGQRQVGARSGGINVCCKERPAGVGTG